MDSGLSKTVSMGSVSQAPPTVSISRTGERLTIDGVEIVFQVAPDTESPAEVNFFFPKLRALYMADNGLCHLHDPIPRAAIRCGTPRPGASISTMPYGYSAPTRE